MPQRERNASPYPQLHSPLMAMPVAVITAALLLGGCTVVQIENAEGVATKVFPGIAVIHVNGDGRNVAANVRGLGVYIASDAVSIGFHAQQAVWIDDFSMCLAVQFTGKDNLVSEISMPVQSPLPTPQM